ncbi:hypothetical protein BpHYR1_024740 [Brachionus plicatilis]|uniref:Uncharacterized protein n=1 Tax=Brachionus plicatilis TaxID=10195 RepID=A0A3M7P963_BRAPC|nr:hypothetical protein BpHYR1_024740 [Brachionus plicatilis]
MLPNTITFPLLEKKCDLNFGLLIIDLACQLSIAQCARFSLVYTTISDLTKTSRLFFKLNFNLCPANSISSLVKLWLFKLNMMLLKSKNQKYKKKNRFFGSKETLFLQNIKRKINYIFVFSHHKQIIK